MSLPTQAKLGPFTYTISRDKSAWKRLKIDRKAHWGFTHHATATILLNPRMEPALQRTILLHELLHAAAFSSGILTVGKLTEERFVSAVAPMLIDCMDRSPDVAAFLFGAHGADE